MKVGPYAPREAIILAIREGDSAPDFTLDAVGGGRVSFQNFRGRPVLLIFLRHLG